MKIKLNHPKNMAEVSSGTVFFKNFINSKEKEN